ncbi:MAG TPA: penicillin-binding transpeptidase domain-containing protein [Clostridia bacterium]|nr:penicillin-binding transpeptidase domain-containing protein [Clostridia bacterium]
MKQLRHNIRLTATVLIALFVLLGAYFGYSVYFYGGRWFASPYNPRLSNQKQSVVAGDICDRNGMTLATTVNGTRAYPPGEATRRAIAHVVGDSAGMVANGVETFMASYLLGFQTSPLNRLTQMFSGGQRRGDDLTLTLDANLTRYAADVFPSGFRGAVVVLNWKTGEILAMTSLPDFDPLDLSDALKDSAAGALVNRATQGLYPPGSTFKIVTYSAAYENLPDLGGRRFSCLGQLPIERTVVTEAGNIAHGSLDMRAAFAQSCNNAFAALALELGYTRLEQEASAFGFNENVLFRDLVLYNSSYPVNNQTRDDLAWSGIGQGRVLATPLHMAMVAATVANDGVMMEPHLLLSVTQQGKAANKGTPSVYKRVLSGDAAALVRDAMLAATKQGTGSQAAISGHSVAGKTGSAEVSDDKTLGTHAWYVGFIDEQEHPLAISVVVEHGGSGGSVAAPVARKVLLEALELGY